MKYLLDTNVCVNAIHLALEVTTMEAIYQIYEKMPEVITIPAELRNRRVEVILQPLENEPDLAELAAQVGMKLEDVKDLHGLRFAGSMPDLPPRAPQEPPPVRLELDFE